MFFYNYSVIFVGIKSYKRYFTIISCQTDFCRPVLEPFCVPCSSSDNKASLSSDHHRTVFPWGQDFKWAVATFKQWPAKRTEGVYRWNFRGRFGSFINDIYMYMQSERHSCCWWWFLKFQFRLLLLLVIAPSFHESWLNSEVRWLA